ncbi:hypothetical protein [Marininema halotolerans]|uniref:DUF3784 domain-containing protein n=1 Tax=Marininema halotolerans TaxID=1155944 RepID=A0A1I6SU40_9BACL|nr:hypothetical protein [Marininema halotolerans]SFS80454.1 hypothetical protein SAMN05444972_10840 [Marininema halotolerans]
MDTISLVLLGLGAIMLFAAKAAMGNRDGDYMDAEIERMKPQQEKQKDANRSVIYLCIGLAFVIAGISLSIV